MIGSSGIYQNLEQLYPVVQMLVFFGFFGFSAVCLKYSSNDERVKKVFVAAVIIGLFVPTMTGYMFPPFNSLWKFTDPAPESQTSYQTVIVDANGEEYLYPGRATPPTSVDSYFVGSTNESDRERMALYMLKNVREYQRYISSGNVSFSDEIRYARPLTTAGLDAGTNILRGKSVVEKNWMYSLPQDKEIDIQGIRVYRTTTNTSGDGFDITSQKRVLAYEYSTNSTIERYD